MNNKTNVIGSDTKGGVDYTIKAMATDKKAIPLRKSMKDGIIPRYPCSLLISGRSGSGKTCLVSNLLTRPELYGEYFHTIAVYSPTAGTLDDTYKCLNLHKDNIYNEFSAETLEQYLAGRKKQIESKGIKWVSKNSRVLLILDDVIADQQFLKSPVALSLFSVLRHYLTSVMVLTQSYNKIPRSLRLQANGTFIFPTSESEILVLLDEITPPGMNKKDFRNVLTDATSGEFDFLYVNAHAKPGNRVRKNINDKVYA